MLKVSQVLDIIQVAIQFYNELKKKTALVLQTEYLQK